MGTRGYKLYENSLVEHMECQICFAENCRNKYTCFKCKKNMCYACLEMYINTTSDFLKCSCTEYIFPSSLEKVRNVEKYKLFLLKRIEMNFFDDISSMKDFLERTRNIREKRHNLMLDFPLCIKYTIDNCFQKELKSVKQKLDKKKVDFTKICHRTSCNGTILSNNSCQKCSYKYCEFCMEIEDDGHKCNQEDILSKQYIQNIGIRCPNCNLPIEKSSGCSYLTCAACDTKFEHITNTVSRHGGHSTKVDVNTQYKVSLKLLDKYPDLPKQIVEKINKIENYELKYDKSIIKNLISDKKSNSIRYYEKYMQEQKKYRDNIKILEKLNNASSKEDVLKFLH